MEFKSSCVIKTKFTKKQVIESQINEIKNLKGRHEKIVWIVEIKRGDVFPY